MIIHLAEVWAMLLVAFVAGCFSGALLFRRLARSRLRLAQSAATDVLVRASDTLRDRLGLTRVWRPRRAASAVIAASPIAPNVASVWAVAGRAVASTAPLPEARVVDDEDDPPLPEFFRSVGVNDGVDEGDRESGVAEPDDEAETIPRIQRGTRPALPRLPPPPSVPDLREANGGRMPDSASGANGGEPRGRPTPVHYARPLLVARVDGETEIVDGLEVRRPATLTEPRNGVPDNLQRIRGIGERNEVRLNSLGIFHFSQIAAWTPAEIRWIGRQLSFPERIENDDWVGQAIVLGSGGQTGFTKSAERRRARRRYGRESPDPGEESVDES